MFTSKTKHKAKTIKQTKEKQPPQKKQNKTASTKRNTERNDIVIKGKFHRKGVTHISFLPVSIKSEKKKYRKHVILFCETPCAPPAVLYRDHEVIGSWSVVVSVSVIWKKNVWPRNMYYQIWTEYFCTYKVNVYGQT